MKQAYDKKLQRILSDNTSGSRDLLVNLNNYLKTNLKKMKDPESLIKNLKSEFKSFHAVIHYLNSLEKVYKKDIAGLNEFFRDTSYEETVIYENIFNNLPVHLVRSEKILTISNSRTVYEIVKRIKRENSKISILVCESRPNLEGRELITKLEKEKIKVQLVTEAMCAYAVQQCDSVLTGADIILAKGNIVNKIGSLNLAVLCKYYQKPFYVIADKSKRIETTGFAQKKHPGSEIWDVKDSKIKIDNFYFEEINRKLVTKLITN